MRNVIRENVKRVRKKEYIEKLAMDLLVFLLVFLLTYIYSKTHQEHDSIYDFRMKFPEMSELEVVFCYGNGRFLGNLLGIIFIPHTLSLSIIKAGLSVLIIDLTGYLFSFRLSERLLFLLGVGLMTKSFFFQMYYYSSSFFNYIPPLIFVLIALIMIFKENKGRPFEIFLIAMVGFFGAFFIEHISVFNVLIAFCLAVYFFKNNALRFVYSIIWFLTAGIGFAVMMIYPYFFVEEPLETSHKFTHSFSFFIFNMGQMVVSVYLGNLVIGLFAALLYARYDCKIHHTKDLSSGGIVITLLIVLSVIGGEGILLASPFLFYQLQKNHGILRRNNELYIFMYSIVYFSTLLFLFVDFRGESMCLQFSNFTETILWVLVFRRVYSLECKTDYQVKSCGIS